MDTTQKRAYVAPALAPHGEVTARTLGDVFGNRSELDPTGTGVYIWRPMA